MIVDGIVILIIVILGLLGMQKGIFLSVMRMFSYIFSIFLARAIYPIVTNIISEKTKIFDFVKNHMSQTLNLKMASGTESLKAQSDIIESLNIPKSFIESLNENNNVEIYKILKVDNIVDYISAFLATIIINSVTMIVIFILSNIIINLAINMINIATTLPVIDQINKAGGAIFGVLQSIIIIWLLFLVINISKTKDIVSEIEKSYFAIYLYNNNIIENMTTKILIKNRIINP